VDDFFGRTIAGLDAGGDRCQLLWRGVILQCRHSRSFGSARGYSSTARQPRVHTSQPLVAGSHHFICALGRVDWPARTAFGWQSRSRATLTVTVADAILEPYLEASQARQCRAKLMPITILNGTNAGSCSGLPSAPQLEFFAFCGVMACARRMIAASTVMLPMRSLM